MIDTPKLEEAADSGLPGMTCSASLVWHAGPAKGGGGTAQREMPVDADLSFHRVICSRQGASQ
ncbi:MAG: hypothetical protein EBU75_13110 [Betaproteobacteria bacterium]|nr:hypothetical protein [Betaproteobacteria bacterium]